MSKPSELGKIFPPFGMDTIFFLKGLIIGFVIAAPVGPIGILCARRTLMFGRRAGFFSGMGAATADAIYGFVAAFGLTLVSDFLVAHNVLLRIVGSSLLCILGVKALVANPALNRDDPKSIKKYAGLYTSMFFLTLTNPMTIFSFAAVFAGFGLAGVRGSVYSAGVLILGVFLGSALWWLFLVGIFSIFRKRFHTDQLRWVNRISGGIIIASGILALLSLKW
ncbi:MAG TPA: LysE family transporter [Nitrospirota bacterium]|nr:LysE family transporter [Nitrospirota bacterium]